MSHAHVHVDMWHDCIMHVRVWSQMLRMAWMQAPITYDATQTQTQTQTHAHTQTQTHAQTQTQTQIHAALDDTMSSGAWHPHDLDYTHVDVAIMSLYEHMIAYATEHDMMHDTQSQAHDSTQHTHDTSQQHQCAQAQHQQHQHTLATRVVQLLSLWTPLSRITPASHDAHGCINVEWLYVWNADVMSKW